jgi:hypothetical protein
MARILLCISLYIVVIHAAHAKSMTVLGAGNKSCSDWTEASASNMVAMSSWVEGLSR